jgi:HAE1 family hydrophobic/amphiphilic exporter-1
MGFVVIFGMLAASCIAIFLIPVTFYVVEKLGGGKHPPAVQRGLQPAAAAQTEGATGI